jgi:hypothetical protein
MRKLRWQSAAVPAALLALLALALGVWWAGRTPAPPGATAPPVAPKGPGPAQPLVEIGPAKLSAADKNTGTPIWEAMLKGVELTEDKATVNMDEATIFDKAGQPAVHLSAKQFRYNLNSNDFEVLGDVRVVSKRGIAFKTERVNWVNAKRDIVCPGPVTAIHKNVVIRTGRLIFHTATDRVECPGKVTLTTQTARGSASSGTLDLKTQTMDLKGLAMTIIDVEAAKKEFEAAQRETSAPAAARAPAAKGSSAGRASGR